MKQFTLFYLLIVSFACNSQTSGELNPELSTEDSTTEISQVDEYYNDRQHNLSSTSHGSVSNGSIVNSKLIPFAGKNFHYFDTNSYLLGRAFSHERVIETILSSFNELDSTVNDREFCVMECSNQHGGKIYPHRTHQNGLSVDFMMPKIKNGKPDYSFDNLGAHHYLLEFDENGISTEDPTIALDFNTIALQLLTLEKHARLHGLKIHKVIINTSLKDELYSSEYGKELKTSGIYIVINLSKLINALHDDHFHVDFELAN